MLEEQTRVCNRHCIEVITKEKASEIIEYREPRGLFIEQTNKGFVGIDNEDGEAYTEDFKSFDDCINWILGGDVEAKECYSCATNCDDLYKYDGKYYCAECLLELLKNEKEIETFNMGTGYMLDGEFIGNDQDNGLDEIVENLIGNLDIKKVNEVENV